MKNRSRQIQFAFLSMIAGVFLVLFTMVIINQFNQAGQKEKKSEVTELNIKKEVKKKPKKKIVKKKIRKKPKRLTKAPPPQISSNISGSSFGLSMFEMDLSDISNALLGDIKDVIMTEETVDQKPKVRKRSPIEYPTRAKARGITGFVTFRILVNSQGSIESVKIDESHPEGVFDNVAMEAIRKWHFEPAKFKGQQVSAWVRQKIRFELN